MRDNPIDCISSPSLKILVEESKSFQDLIKNKLSTHTSIVNKNKLITRLKLENIDYTHLIKTINSPGMIFGKITLIKLDVMKHNRKTWLCQCECGLVFSVYDDHIKRGNTRSCGKCKYGKKSKCFKGYEEISGNRFYDIKKKALARKYEFSITIEYIWNLFISQDKKCALSGSSLEFGKLSKNYGTASLDRIDNTKGYIEGNVQWLHKDVNKMKNVHTQEYFLSLCRKISDNMEKKL